MWICVPLLLISAFLYVHLRKRQWEESGTFWLDSQQALTVSSFDFGQDPPDHDPGQRIVWELIGEHVGHYVPTVVFLSAPDCETWLFCLLIVTPPDQACEKSSDIPDLHCFNVFYWQWSYIDNGLVVPVASVQSALHSCDSAGAAGRDAFVLHSLII